jgi:hypothetical protein
MCKTSAKVVVNRQVALGKDSEQKSAQLTRIQNILTNSGLVGRLSELLHTFSDRLMHAIHQHITDVIHQLSTVSTAPINTTKRFKRRL